MTTTHAGCGDAAHPIVDRLALAVKEGLEANARRWLAFSGHVEGEWIELQALDVPNGRYPTNQFAHAQSADTVLALLAEAEKLGATGVYGLINRINPAVATREAAGRWHVAKKGASTTDADIVARRFLYIDCDYRRPRGTSSTREELRATLDVTAQVHDRLAAILGSTDALAVGMSGNGGAVLVALESLPTTAVVTAVVKGILAALARLHNAGSVEIDTSVAELKRLCPAWGTTKRKGAPGVKERPHRRTALVTPATVTPVGQAELERLLEALIGQLDEEGRALVKRAMGQKSAVAAPSSTEANGEDVFARANACPIRDALDRCGLADGDAITCPGCGTTGGPSDSSVAIVGNGLKCLHSRCAQKGRSGFRSVVDVVAEHLSLRPIEAVRRLGVWFGFDVPAPTRRSGQGGPRPGAPKSSPDPGAPKTSDAPPEGAGRPTILVTTELAQVVDQAEQVLVGDPTSPFYTRGGVLVRIVRDGARAVAGLTRPTEAPTIIEVPVEFLRERLARVAAFEKIVHTKGGGEMTVATLPPDWIAKTLRARGEWPFPPIEGVTETPSPRPDGTILDQPGYDPATALLFDPGSTRFPAVPKAPTRADAEQAYAVLCEPFSEFPFVAGSDRVATIAALLTIVGRAAIAGPVPAFAFRATTPGTGKGLCVDAVTLAATGRPAAIMVAPRDDDEARKSILAIGLEGPPVVLLDNIEGGIGGPSIAAALTAQVFKGRILGVSRTVTVTLRSVWLFTGNNIAFKGDLGRRVVPIDMDANCEHPEDRSGFRHANLRQHVLASRPQLVRAALTLLSAFVQAGRPAHGESRKGSFEAWDDLIRGALMWVGAGDPLAGCERVRKEGDGDLEVLRSLLGAWAAAFGDKPQTVAGVIKKASEQVELRAALALLDPRSDGERLNPRVIGKALLRLRGRIIDGSRIERGADYKGSATWSVVSA